MTVVLLAVFAAIGLVSGRRWVRSPGTWVLVVLGASVVAAGLLFLPVRCATGQVATPFNDVTGEEPPTGCASVTGLGLPELGRFAGDTVGYGLVLAAAGLAVGTAGTVMTRAAQD